MKLLQGKYSIGLILFALVCGLLLVEYRQQFESMSILIQLLILAGIAVTGLILVLKDRSAK